MSTKGWGPANRLWIGSVADRLVRELTLPLLIIRPKAEGGKAPRAAADAVIRRILLPLDQSRFSEGVLEGAAMLAEIFSAAVIPLHVVRARSVSAGLPLRPSLAPTSFPLGLGTEAAATYLRNIASDLRVRGVDVDTPEVVQGGDVASIQR